MRTHEAQRPFPQGVVPAMLSSSARRFPHHAAFVAGRHTVTFGELDGAADRVARQVIADGTPGPVVLPLTVAPGTAAVYYGVLRGGRVVVPVNPLLPVPAVIRICQQVSASWLASEHEYCSRLAEEAFPPATRLVDLDALISADILPSEGRGVFVEEQDRLDEVAAQILFTSGTTGPSKAVELSHRAVKANAWQMSSAHEITHASIVLCHLPMLNPMHTNAAIYQGATQVLCRSNEIEAAAALVSQHRVTHFYSQPIRLDRIARDPALADLDLSSVQYIAAGSRAIAADVVRTLADRYGAYVFQGYGQTESCYLSHSDSPSSPKLGSVGFGLARTETRVVSLDSGAVLPPGTLGELQIRGPQLMNRYLNRPDMQPFTADGWFRSGDVAQLDAEGRVSVFDRLVDVASRAGRLVSPSQVERRAEEDPDVREAGAVFSGPDGHPELYLFVVLDTADQAAGGEGTQQLLGGGSAVAEQVLFRLNDRLPPEQHVSSVVVVADLPRLSVNGKVDRKALRQQVPTTGFTGRLHDVARAVR